MSGSKPARSDQSNGTPWPPGAWRLSAAWRRAAGGRRPARSVGHAPDRRPRRPAAPSSPAGRSAWRTAATALRRLGPWSCSQSGRPSRRSRRASRRRQSTVSATISARPATRRRAPRPAPAPRSAGSSERTPGRPCRRRRRARRPATPRVERPQILTIGSWAVHLARNAARLSTRRQVLRVAAAASVFQATVLAQSQARAATSSCCGSARDRASGARFRRDLGGRRDAISIGRSRWRRHR